MTNDFGNKFVNILHLHLHLHLGIFVRVIGMALSCGLGVMGISAVYGEEEKDGLIWQRSGEGIQVFVTSTRMPGNIQSVGILPVTVASGRERSSVMTSGREMVNRSLGVEIQRTGVVKPVTITPDQLEMLTGRMRWRSGDALPEDMLKNFAERTPVQAILFSEVTEYDPYRKPALGLRFHMVDVRNGETIWQMDHLFQGHEESAGTRKKKGLGKIVDLDRLLGLPDGEPEDVRTSLPVGSRFIGEAVRKAVETIPRR